MSSGRCRSVSTKHAVIRRRTYATGTQRSKPKWSNTDRSQVCHFSFNRYAHSPPKELTHYHHLAARVRQEARFEEERQRIEEKERKRSKRLASRSTKLPDGTVASQPLTSLPPTTEAESLKRKASTTEIAEPRDTNKEVGRTVRKHLDNLKELLAKAQRVPLAVVTKREAQLQREVKTLAEYVAKLEQTGMSHAKRSRAKGVADEVVVRWPTRGGGWQMFLCQRIVLYDAEACIYLVPSVLYSTTRCLSPRGCPDMLTLRKGRNMSDAVL